MGKERLFQDSNGNGWDILLSGAWRLVEAWFVDAEETVRYTQATALAALSDSDREEGEEWAREQGRELPEAFGRVPMSMRVSAEHSVRRAA